MAKNPMSADFARWYSEAFMDEGAKRDQRWKGVVDMAAKADHKTVEVLTRIAFQTSVSAAGRKNEELANTYATVISTISGGDTTFDPSHSTRELQILAAAALVKLLKNHPDAALVITTASFGGARQPDLPMDLAGLAENALVELSARKHERVDISELKLSAPKVDFAVAPEVLQTMDPAQWSAQFDLLRSATTSAIERVVSGQNRTVAHFHRQITLDEEELQMLWWLFGEYSQLLDKPFSEIDVAIKPLVLAQELGGMTAVSPGPSSIKAMLLRAGVGTKELRLADVVNSADMEWAKSVSQSAIISPATTPIHFALEHRAELGANDAWQAAWAGLTGIPADISLPAVKLAELFYREHIFLNVRA